MAGEKELLIKISTVADTSGVAEQADAIKQLDLTASKTANSIATALAKTEAAEKSGTAETRVAQAEKAQAALRQIESTEKAAAAAKSAADGLKTVGAATKELTGLGRDAAGVMDGLARGGLDGLAQAGGNAAKVIRTLAGGAIGTALIPIVALAGVGLAILRKRAEENETAIKKAFESHGKAAELYQAKLAELTVATSKNLDAQLKKIQEVAAAYDSVTAAIDRAYARQQKLDAARGNRDAAKIDTAEKAALAKATTPEQRDQIQQNFARQRLQSEAQKKFNEFDTADLRAGVEVKNAEEAQAKARERDAALKAEVAAAASLAEQKKGEASVFSSGVFKGDFSPTVSAQRENAQKEALAAREALKLAQERADVESKTNAETILAAQARIDAAKVSKEENAINRDTFRETLKGKQAELSQPTAGLDVNARNAAAELEKTRAEIAARKRAATDGGFGATADTAGLETQQRAQESALASAQRAQALDAKNRRATSGVIGGLLAGDDRNQSTNRSQADTRAFAATAGGPPPVQVAGANPGSGGTIQKDGETIKVSGENTVAELRKLGETTAASSKAVEKAAAESAKVVAESGPKVEKAAAATSDALAKYNSAIVGTFEAQAAKINALARQIDEVRRAQAAKADRS